VVKQSGTTSSEAAGYLFVFSVNKGATPEHISKSFFT
jgi:hypothetical protein